MGLQDKILRHQATWCHDCIYVLIRTQSSAKGNGKDVREGEGGFKYIENVRVEETERRGEEKGREEKGRGKGEKRNCLFGQTYTTVMTA